MEHRRYQVFVSSTFFDLQDERAAVVSALLQLDAFPAGMELFPASDDDAWTLIRRVIDSSDYYLLVVGGRYGSVDPESELSYTEMEYDYAVELGRPVMAFLHADPDKIELGKSEKQDAAREKLDAFRKKVESKKHVKYWSGPDDLAGKVALSFADFRQRYPAVGWIRGDAEVSTDALAELNELRKQVAEMERRSLGSTSAPAGAERFAQGDEATGFTLMYDASFERTSQEKGRRYATATGSLDAEVTWNELFATVAPRMLDEAEEGKIRGQIIAWLTKRFGQVAEEAGRASLNQEGEAVERLYSLRVRLELADFETLIIQFRALGLIAKSDRPRSVDDRDRYWTLTPYGDEHLTSLRAIRRDRAD